MAPSSKASKKVQAEKEAASIMTAAGESGYPFTATTNKTTNLIRFGDPSVALPVGHYLTVHDEDGAFGTVATLVDGNYETGTVIKDDYDRV